MAVVLKSTDPVEQASDESAREASGLMGFNLDDFADQGRKRLEEFRQKIELMLADAKKEAEKLKAQAKEEGYQEGLKQAAVDAEDKLQREAKQQTQDNLKSIESAVDQMRSRYESWMEEYSQSLYSLTLAAAEKLTRQQLATDPNLLVTWAKEAIHSARSATRISIAVHPETLVLVGERLDELLASPGLPEESQIVPDESLGRGEVSVRQTGGEIKAGLTAQLERIQGLLD